MKKSKHSKSSSVFYLAIFCVFILATVTVCFFYLTNKYTQTEKYLKYEKHKYSHLSDYEVHGIDVSRHNGDLNWDEIASHTINDWELKFVFVRATVALADGKLKVDKQFSDNWEKADHNSLIRGAYHFYSPAVSVDEQAKMYIDKVDLKKGDLPPVLDVENFEKGNIIISKKDIPKVEKWLEIVTDHYGVNPIIYTSKKMYIDYFKNIKFKKYRFWIANYGNSISGLDTKDWTFWQHTELGKINSHKCDFDLNVFNGNETELEKLCIQ